MGRLTEQLSQNAVFRNRVDDVIDLCDDDDDRDALLALLASPRVKHGTVTTKLRAAYGITCSHEPVKQWRQHHHPDVWAA